MADDQQEQEGVSIDAVIAQYQMELVQAKHAEIMAKAEAQMLRDRLTAIVSQGVEETLSGGAKVTGAVQADLANEAAKAAADTRKAEADAILNSKP